MCHASHSQIHTDLSALTLEVGAQTVNDLLADFLGNVVAKHLADAHYMLGSPGLLLGLQGELFTGNMANRALCGGNIAFMNITANRTDPLLHNFYLHFVMKYLFYDLTPLSAYSGNGSCQQLSLFARQALQRP